MDKDEMIEELEDIRRYFGYRAQDEDSLRIQARWERRYDTINSVINHLKRCKCGEPDEEYLYGHFSHDGDTLIQDRKKV